MTFYLVVDRVFSWGSWGGGGAGVPKSLKAKNDNKNRTHAYLGTWTDPHKMQLKANAPEVQWPV